MASARTTYSLFHRVLDKDDAGLAPPWALRGLVHLGGPDSVAEYEAVAGLRTASREPQDVYQVKVVEGDARGMQHAGTAEDAGAWIAYTKLCHLRPPRGEEAVRDRLRLHVRTAPDGRDGEREGAPVLAAIDYAVPTAAALGPVGCAWDSAPPRAAGVQFDTEVVAPMPSVPDRPLRLPFVEEQHVDEKGEPTKPKEEKSFLRKYWMFFLPIIILMMIPAPEDIAPPQGGAREGAGQGTAPARVAAGPAAGPARGRG
ncbi:hypothetical protein MSPP1_001211 [Malassezia sp. CBS 17886]|nr:hypothetical protein MSPP1_001211 [Malassezia sp. CBS 17886]